MSKSSITLCFIHESFLVCTYGYLHGRVQKWRSGGNLRFKPCLLPWLKQGLLLLFFFHQGIQASSMDYLVSNPSHDQNDGVTDMGYHDDFYKGSDHQTNVPISDICIRVGTQKFIYLLVDSLMFPHIYYTAFLLYYYTMLTYFIIQCPYIMI